MDFPSDPTVGLVNGEFSDGDPANGVEASKDTATWANAVTHEIVNVIKAAQITPDDTTVNQLVSAIRVLAGKSLLTVSAADPTVADDSSTGISKGWRWITPTAIWICFDPAAGAAVWKTLVDLAAGDVRYAQLGTANNFSGDQTINGNLTVAGTVQAGA